MQGSIRFIVGLVVCMAAVEANADVSLFVIGGVAMIGLALMASGVNALKGAK